MRIQLLFLLIIASCAASPAPKVTPIDTTAITPLIRWQDRGWHDARINLATKRLQPLVGRQFSSRGELTSVIQANGMYHAVMNYELPNGSIDFITFDAQFSLSQEEHLASISVSTAIQLSGTITAAHVERRDQGRVVIVIALKDPTIEALTK